MEVTRPFISDRSAHEKEGRGAPGRTLGEIMTIIIIIIIISVNNNNVSGQQGGLLTHTETNGYVHASIPKQHVAEYSVTYDLYVIAESSR